MLIHNVSRITFRHLFSLCLLPILLFQYVSIVQADTRQVIQYSYDASGNLTGIIPEQTNNPPTITLTNPSTISFSGQATIDIIGAGLRNALVTSNIAGIQINILSSTNNLLRLQITVDSSVLLGSYPLTISTSLGISTINFTVLPSVNVYPVVAVMAPNDTQSLAISLTASDNTDRIINLQTTDPTIATVTPSTITLPAGQKNFTSSVNLTGISLGQTQLSLSSPDIISQAIPVYVNSPTVLMGNNQFYSSALGVVHQGGTPPGLIQQGPVFTQLGIQKGNAGGTPTTSTSQIISSELGIIHGSFFNSTLPSALLSGTNNNVLTMTGMGLASVDNIVIYPATGLTLGAISSTADGSQITLSVSVSQQQAIGPYQVQLFSSGQRIPASSSQAGIFYVATHLPVIDYVEPIVIARDSQVTLDITGTNFEFIKDIRIEPADGITQSSRFTITADGSQISQEILIDTNATLGDRVVIVETQAGESSAAASVNNTITITNAPGVQITAIQSAALGITKQQPVTPSNQIIELRTTDLGITIGSFISAISPAQSAIGKALTLTVSGAGLQNVNSVSLEPNQGIIISNLNIANDGLSLTFDIDIDINAQQVQRQLILSTPTSTLPALISLSDRFDITAVKPIVTTINPQYIAINAAQVPITVTGLDLDNPITIRFNPQTDISIDSFTVDPTGDRINLLVTTSSNAQPSARTLVVETASGLSSEIPSLSNTVNIARTLSTIDSLLSPGLGIQKGQIAPPSNQFPALLTSPLLGVVIQTSTPPDINTVSNYSTALGLSIGSIATQLSPRAVSIGKSDNLIIQGVGLDNVTVISFEPPEGIIIMGAINTNSAGSQLVVPVQIANDANQTIREVILSTSNNPISFAPQNQGQLLIAGLIPDIFSIFPIQQTQGSSFSLKIRGINLEATPVIAATPANGISFTTPIINTSGTELTTTMIISPNATVGTRVITVTTPAGSTKTNAVPANTFTIIN